MTRETAHDAGVGTVFDRSALELVNHRLRVADPHRSVLYLEAGSGSALERKAGSGSALKSKLRIEPGRAVDAQNGGLEAQNGALEGL